MQIEWEATLNDMADLAFLQIARSPSLTRQHQLGRLVSGFGAAILVGAIYYFLFSMLMPGFTEVVWALRIIPSLIAGIFSGLRYRRIVRKKYIKIFREKYGREPVRVSVELTPEGIITSQPGSHIMFGWKDIASIQEDEKRIIFSTRQGGISVVRKRAFDSEDRIESFLNAAYTLWNKSRPGDEYNSDLD